jgi:hypothetical protein
MPGLVVLSRPAVSLKDRPCPQSDSYTFSKSSPHTATVTCIPFLGMLVEVRYLPTLSRPYLPILPNYVISDESVTLLPVTGVPVAGLYPSVLRTLSTSSKSTVRLLPASGKSDRVLSNNTHLFTRVYMASRFPVAVILSGTSHIQPLVEAEKKENHRPGPISAKNRERKVR